MHERLIGTSSVSAIGLGTAGLCVLDPPTPREGTRVIHAALDAGITVIDTATCYVPAHLQQGYGEALIARALRDRGRDDVLVASKAGIARIDTVEFSTDFRTDARPSTIRSQCEASLRALGVDCIGLYLLHVPDPEVPLAETAGAFACLRREGLVRHVGFCSVDARQLEEARAEVEVSVVQNSFSPGHREHRALIDMCAELGIAFMAYSPLGGLGERAARLPSVAPSFATVAAERGVSPQRVALAWQLALSHCVIPIPGARRPETIRDSARAAELELSEDELRRLDAGGVPPHVRLTADAIG